MTSISLPIPRLTVRENSDRLLLALLSVLCVSSALVGRFVFLLRPFDNDAAIFIYMGKMVLNGGRLCHDLIDNKFPSVGLMTSIIYRCLGTWWMGYVIFQTILSFTSSWLLSRTAGRTVGNHAKLPTLLFAIIFLNFTTAVFGGFQLETIQVFFTVLAASASIDLLQADHKSDAFTAGLCAGCGMMFKPTAGGILLALFVAMVIGRKTLSSFSFVLLGACIPLGFIFAYLTGANLLGDMPALYHQISTYAHETVFDTVELLKPATALALLGFPILIRGFVFRRQRENFANSPSGILTLFVTLWLIIETAGVILQRRMYAYHFLPMIPPAALLYGMLPRKITAESISAGLIPVALLSIFQAGNLIATTRPGEDRLPVSDYLAVHTQPTDSVWMDAWPRLILETGLHPASRLPFTFLFTNYDQAGLDYSAGIIEDFKRTKPAYIILPMPLDRRMQYQIDFIPELNRRPLRRENYLIGWHRIEQYTLENYTKETVIGNDAVYHRRTK